MKRPQERQVAIVLLLLLLTLQQVVPMCPNSCSGHGYCGFGNVCDCYEGWRGGAADCSLRNCPTGPAWANKPQSLDAPRANVECSNAGSCNKRLGLCECFPGFTGNACQRSKTQI